MKALKVMGTIDNQGQLHLDQPIQLAQSSRVEVIVLVQEESEENDDTPNETILSDFRQAWHEAMTGQIMPVSEIWKEIENV